MYNQEIKEQFIAEHATGEKERFGWRSMFETIGEYESLVGKDLSEMSIPEVVEALKPAVIGTYGTAAGVQCMIKAYARWCVDNCPFLYPNKALSGLEIDDIDASEYYSKTIFTSEDELIFELESVRRFDEGFMEGLVLVLAWIGIEQKDVLSVNIRDVDLQERTIYVERLKKAVSFSERIADVLKVYEKTKVGSRSAGGTTRPVYRDDSYNTYVRKYSPKGQLGEKPLTPSRIRNAVGTINELYIAQGKPSRLWNGNIVASGALYRVRLLELSGVDVFSKKNKDAVVEAFGVKSKLHEVLWMYRNYKRAFNL